VALSSTNTVSRTLVSSVERHVRLVAAPGQRVKLAWQLVEAGDDVEMVGVARCDGEGLLFPATADKDPRSAVKVAVAN
jgi:hypothetical protein